MDPHNVPRLQAGNGRDLVHFKLPNDYKRSPASLACKSRPLPCKPVRHTLVCSLTTLAGVRWLRPRLRPPREQHPLGKDILCSHQVGRACFLSLLGVLIASAGTF
ncbi:hypothetical protein GHT09_019849 [Marmota monax]|uniref:Uncharacterized protein n=1 Tax=Marmota monax TaxID=9995 RepID=A0A834UIC2_MARMO|nr:hypothetical protein GHT09_019849 [Marmota monax]